MSEPPVFTGKIVPAKLAFLTIYNPSISLKDETLKDQIIFYYSSASKARRRAAATQGPGNVDNEEENERMRQVGLAQGMVEFARGFSGGEPVDSIETEKSRIVLYELERDWWILASIDLTRLPAIGHGKSATSGTSTPPAPEVEFSSREVSPPALLIQQLIRAHGIFLLHHGPSLNEIYMRLSKSRFCSILDRFWSFFAKEWDVLLNGNPAADIFGGLKLAAGGELGIGVGEEDWGSGEREVLEGLVDGTEGLIDLVVSRFGEPPANTAESSINQPSSAENDDPESGQQWPYAGVSPNQADGIIFSGLGAISRSSLKSVTDWMELLYTYGEDAYGVKDNPTSTRRRRRDRASASRTPSAAMRADQRVPLRLNRTIASPGTDLPVGIPPPIVTAANESLDRVSASIDSADAEGSRTPSEAGSTISDTLMKYFTLGYGSSWGGSFRKRMQSPNSSVSRDPSPHVKDQDENREATRSTEAQEQSAASLDTRITSQARRDRHTGHFMIGLKGSLDEDSQEEENNDDDEESRILLRSLHVALLDKTENKPGSSTKVGSDSGGHSSTEGPHSIAEKEGASQRQRILETKRARVVVYVRQPFIFTFIFDAQAGSLAMASFYRLLHRSLGPLYRSLLSSTSPDKVLERVDKALIPKSTTSTTNKEPIYDLVYDPPNMTVHTSIPNIPELASVFEPTLTGGSLPWTRIEALNVHTQILNTFSSTRRNTSEVERTCKTSRGWWVVWMRLPHPRTVPFDMKNNSPMSDYREAYLVRKASDYVAPASRSSGRFARDSGIAAGRGGWGPGKLAEGIGIDTRKYIEALLSLNR
ncbi:hypothetical protein L228DRAFT_236702 [Xylona heveae TC161]|uniref:CCZ1/INTU/HSP4 first Longin domain-containing protein n=1 Tax=Xylona heveae (strain CBS 132557 / TC161) TaxID=1328760 RepID=A0A161THA5_XYLHT|nr:hypothetical protein L228DRAFT_236702 [Xylona heveae TC161]KZF25627.1 hypothetical protein L228DRAFT_236702 [Xylona heveae TC161]